MDNGDIRKAREIGRKAAQDGETRWAMDSFDLMEIAKKYSKIDDYTMITKAYYFGFDKEKQENDDED